MVVMLALGALSAASLATRSLCAQEMDARVEAAALLIDSGRELMSAERSGQFLGARSCAAAACHGGVEPDPRFAHSRRHEYVYWLDHDPHARAYQTLLNEKSARMLARLALPTDRDIDKANRLANCFGCHNPQPDQARQAATFYHREGVSCEMCHGAAERWIEPHVSAPWMTTKQQGGAAALGFVDTENVAVRARLCAQCHVGSPGREVNHDLIAAGHPVLKFEFAAYHEMLPKHWRDAAERQANPELERQLWAAGQQASATAALELLASRVDRAVDDEPEAVWPEFAEYDCFACHHELVHPSWRQQMAHRPSSGMADWGSWYFGLHRSAGNDALDTLAKQMQSSFLPDLAAVRQAIAATRMEAPSLEDMLRGSAAAGQPAAPPTVTNWDEAAQWYLALVAWEQSRRDAGGSEDDQITRGITKLRNQLAFPPNFDSPRGIFFDGPGNVSRGEIDHSISELLRQVRQRVEP